MTIEHIGNRKKKIEEGILIAFNVNHSLFLGKQRIDIKLIELFLKTGHSVMVDKSPQTDYLCLSLDHRIAFTLNQLIRSFKESLLIRNLSEHIDDLSASVDNPVGCDHSEDHENHKGI